MKRAIKFHPLAVGVMLACGASFTYADPALEEVTVTAQKREQSLQEVPVAVTAIGETQLIENGIADITDIQKMSPNTTLQVSRGTNSTLTAFIRGIGQQDPLWGYEPGVGIYIDDVYVARPQGAVMDVYDVQRIEVLRGPQGTLYGKNTIGGAVKYVTKKMSGDTEVSIGSTLGSYNQRDFKVSASTGLTDTVNVGAAIASFKRDGYGENILTGEDQYNKDLLSARVSVEFAPTEDLFFRFSADQTNDDSASKHGYRLNPGVNGEPVLSSVYDTESNLPAKNRVDTSGMSLTAEWQVSDSIKLKSVTATREGDSDTVIDFDSVNTASFDVPAYYKDEQFTQEIQLIWEGDNADLVSGLYYYDGTAAGGYDAVLDPITVAVNGSVDTQSLSAYAHYNWQFAEQWNLNLGGRYTKDDKEADVYNALLAGLGTFSHDKYYAGTPDPSVLLVQTDYTNSDSWGEFTPRVGVDYQINRDAMVYAAYSTGFKSGGFDMRGVATSNPLTSEGYAPETVTTAEFGWKLDLLSNRLRLNGALFRADYTDMQLTTQRLVAGAPVGDVLNAGKSRIQGIELEASLAVTDNLTANAVVGYVDAEFIEFIENGVNIADTRDMQNTPDTTAMVQLNWSIPAADGEVVVVPSVSYRSETQIFETPSDLDQEAYALVDLTATYYSANGNWNLGITGRNLADEEYRVAGYNFNGPAFDTAFYGAPRTIALTGSYNF